MRVFVIYKRARVIASVITLHRAVKKQDQTHRVNRYS
jgi:hypothetical protein